MHRALGGGTRAIKTRIGDPALAARLRQEIEGVVRFDPFTRGRYSTDASIYQIEPIGVVIPRTEADIVRVVEIAAAEGVPVLPRGGGTSQCGQTVGAAIVVDVSPTLNRVIELDAPNRRAVVEPGIVLDRLNALLRPHGLFFPVDVSTSSRATIGGMTGNNSCGARSIRFGTMRDNVRAIDATLADGTSMRFGELDAAGDPTPAQGRMTAALLDLGRREADEIAARFPSLQRRVGGYNIDALTPRGANAPPINFAHLLVGSEGTLAFSRRIELRLHSIPKHKILGVCHFPTFYKAMAATKHIVALGPDAVELVDRTMIELARDIPIFRPTIERFVRGEPDALLLVEFAGEELDPQIARLRGLVELMGDLGFPGGVVEAIDPAFQRDVWEVRKSGLNIMMSMKGDGKPVSFIEDCAVSLDDLADYTARLTEIFTKHGTTGTWYAHASVGCLHVRPILNMKDAEGARKMRAIAEEAFEIVREYKGSHSGEHGDGLVRSEFHKPMFGSRMVAAFEAVKDILDPKGVFNPGKIVRAPKMDDRTLFRFKPDYVTPAFDTALDWSAWGGFGGAIEMCNNNGECRKFDASVMCPSYRVTMDEQHVTRGRANSLRLAISGQLGPDAFASDALADTMKLCVGCKGCKRECPTGVDMARMKTEFLYHYSKRHGLSARDRLVAYLPRYAPYLARLAPLANLRNAGSFLAELGERWFGIAAARSLPEWRRDIFNVSPVTSPGRDAQEVVLVADTFSTYFEPENAYAALDVLKAGGYGVHVAAARDGGRPLCCGRTFLAAGLVDEARKEANRLLDAVAPFVERGVPIVGLEPSCLLTLRDEMTAMHLGPRATALANCAKLFEEFLAAEMKVGRLDLPLRAIPYKKAILHGHCHQKAFAAMNTVERILRLVPGLEVETVASSCCGMAGAFGFQAETYETSMRMAEAALLPAVRKAGEDTLIVADGTSCRHQIKDGAGREAMHVARVLAMALSPNETVGRDDTKNGSASTPNDGR
ncbi:MAG TPA: FAD-linked oxidase C-terminal domain-containing protein [Alphaproteobacteria bacterium]|nr:FAD-linked oxidase C-terminal domain-containing protein [Alphaproteobacteria bacterium]